MASFLLLDAQSLLAMERSIPVAPPGVNDRGWARLVDALGPGRQGPAAFAAAAGAAGAAAAATKGATAAKVIAVLAAKQIAIIVVSACVGAGLYAALGPEREPYSMAISRDTARTAAALPSGSVSEPRALVASATAAPTSPQADPDMVIDAEEAERNLIQRARAAIGRAAFAGDNKTRAREIAAVRSALDEHERRFKSPQLIGDRDMLRRQVLLFEQAHTPAKLSE
jgi:hypothetical protein